MVVFSQGLPFIMVSAMTYFPDLSPYRYGHGSHPSVVHVGWLDGVHDFTRETVDKGLIEK